MEDQLAVVIVAICTAAMRHGMTARAVARVLGALALSLHEAEQSTNCGDPTCPVHGEEAKEMRNAAANTALAN